MAAHEAKGKTFGSLCTVPRLSSQKRDKRGGQFCVCHSDRETLCAPRGSCGTAEWLPSGLITVGTIVTKLLELSTGRACH